VAALTFAQLERLEAFEHAWDPELGGARSRGYRDVIGYAVARLVAMGAAEERIPDYVREILNLSRELANEPEIGSA
jgi:hypothetical protein